ncbi:MAG: thioredoxin domain-containing protein [Bacteroidetes bacterium]|nr:thioredoxin domain-containing protein [Bacteroidota bacterium]
MQTYTNQLIHESSPYLLQHAHNPVNWYPWGEAALEKAKKENKLLIISIGYAACHWCHVMEHESFEDTTVAKIMNDYFVCIKVDREERPDVDDVYMTACHLASGNSCGWPLNAFALPDGRPVWAGTYFPKKNWIEVLEYFNKTHKEESGKLNTHAEKITQGIQQNGLVDMVRTEKEFEETSIHNIGRTFLNSIDLKRGGRKGAPKFPMPNNYQFLLEYYHFTKDEQALQAVTTTLNNMAWGGIYDHLGGGFARYSVDGEWIAPHFEKMLYDNGQLVSLYSQAHQLTKKPLYKEVVEKTLDFIERELTDKEGGFYSSLDADSEGEEGKFYVWTKEEISRALNNQAQESVINAFYEIAQNGNWEHGNNILYRRKSFGEISQKLHISEEEVIHLLVQAKEKLFNKRTERIRPGLDDKILTSWNALMLKGYVDAYRAFQDAEYLSIALTNAAFIKKNMLQEGNRLNRNYKNGKSSINAFLDDYALTIQAFTALYEVTFDEKWLYLAKDLLEYSIEHFYDAASGMFYYTSDIDPPLVARKMETGDNVIPGSNSIMARNLFNFGLYFHNTEYTKMAEQMLKNVAKSIESTSQPSFYSNWCSLYLDFIRSPYEVAVVGEKHKRIASEMMINYLPDARFLGGKDEGTLPLLENKLQEGQTTIYVCQNKICKLPVTEVGKALEMMVFE